MCDPKISQFTHVMKNLLCNYVETAMWHANGSTGNLPKEQRKRQLVNSKNLTLMVEEKSSHADLEHRQFREARQQRT